MIISILSLISVPLLQNKKKTRKVGEEIFHLMVAEKEEFSQGYSLILYYSVFMFHFCLSLLRPVT